MAVIFEQEVAWSRRAFATSQRLLAGAITARIANTVAVGWHSTTIHPETGAVAVVRRGGPLESLVGDIVRVSHGEREVWAYVHGARAVPVDLSLTRNTFGRLAPLWSEAIDCVVEVA